MNPAKTFAALLLISTSSAWAAQANREQSPSVPGVAANLPRNGTTATVLSPEPAPTAPKGWRPTAQIGIPPTQRVVPPAKTASAASLVRRPQVKSSTPQR